MKNERGVAVTGLIFILSLILVVASMVGGTHKAYEDGRKNRKRIQELGRSRAAITPKNEVADEAVIAEDIEKVHELELDDGEAVLDLKNQISLLAFMLNHKKQSEEFESMWLVRFGRWILQKESKKSDVQSSDSIQRAITKFEEIDAKPCDEKIEAIRNMVEEDPNTPQFKARCEGDTLIYEQDFLELGKLFLLDVAYL